MTVKRRVLKVVLMGDGGVGKTSLRRRYLGQGFKGSYNMTIGADFSIKRIGKNAIQIWDLAGQPGFNQIRKSYYYGAQGGILVFDISKRESFRNIRVWINEFISNGKIGPLILVGNKNDLRDSMNSADVVSHQEGVEISKKLSLELKCPVIYEESSAKNGFNVEKIFEELISGMVGENNTITEDETSKNKNSNLINVITTDETIEKSDTKEKSIDDAENTTFT
ncbi:MAG: GTP-binding protein [Candidatus Heimdallarchaeota archaeon]|nr:GTP-binding protein [Candidatus Heimdallarchaeota archaeon]MDH5644741.1 GTP-binding protein [Candidatus Heimdallarchaeota archaeon]